ncbi:NAD(P)-dependent dehydrogenase (short-subunit alcohol dehydrogenase family)/uncharacterized OB-fold protein [Pseudacidovorax sp. 1753]|uniref:SDR family NAD(P)-dependent oxidoreductase n=1 Tax=Pseudacidovorax sp. 1753 TaxID=3156419 RepID=UPI003390B3EE
MNAPTDMARPCADLTATQTSNRAMALPPAARSRVARGLTAAAATGHILHLQCCDRCGALQYPPREACGQCLADTLRWQPQPGGGQLLAQSTLRHSNDAYFAQHLPWRIGTIKLDAGPTVIAFLSESVTPDAARVTVSLRLDRAGEAVLVCQPEQEASMAADSKLQQQMSCDPRGRVVLVTDGATVHGQALVDALLAAGARKVWVGHARAVRLRQTPDRLATRPEVQVVPLDLGDLSSVAALGPMLGNELDIVVNNAQVNRARRAEVSIVDDAAAEMAVNYLGLLQLWTTLGPVLRARGAGNQGPLAAWVNVLSVYALQHFATLGTYSASAAAALSLSQGMRAQALGSGVRVVHVLPGPLDDEAHANVAGPKLGPAALASAIVVALRQGVEDVFPGDIAKEWRDRLHSNPKALERELAHESP